MTRPCECGHGVIDHGGFFDDCIAPCGDRYCGCRGFLERPTYLRRLVRWLREVPR